MGIIMLEEFARTQIAEEEMHEAELKKMLRDNFRSDILLF
ncbi:hypothetical protein Ct9H90mP29_14070 [bacterium]|nr:MAG: hypothetical protein Ct9H90mP29_14070 [bacterium]